MTSWIAKMRAQIWTVKDFGFSISIQCSNRISRLDPGRLVESVAKGLLFISFHIFQLCIASIRNHSLLGCIRYFKVFQQRHNFTGSSIETAMKHSSYMRTGSQSAIVCITRIHFPLTKTMLINRGSWHNPFTQWNSSFHISFIFGTPFP